MQRILLFALFLAQAAPCNATLEAQLNNLLEDASLLLHNLSRQHLLWQCNATQAPANAHRLASCQQTAQGEAKTVLLKLPTTEALAELLSQLAAPNGIHDRIPKDMHRRRSKRQEYTSREHKEMACFNYAKQTYGRLEEFCNSSPAARVSFKIGLHCLTETLADAV